jgi:hypothetical protein
VDFAKLPMREFEQLLNMASQHMILFDTPAFYERLKEYLLKEYKEKKYYEVNINMLKNMSLEQMEKLQQLVPQLKEDYGFANTLFQKQFYFELNVQNQENFTLVEKRENLIKMYEFTKKLPSKFEGLRSSLLNEILQNGLKLSNFLLILELISP